jgi:hypothetical protein
MCVGTIIVSAGLTLYGAYASTVFWVVGHYFAVSARSLGSLPAGNSVRYLDEDPIPPDEDRVGLHRDHARWTDDFSRPDIEAPAVKIAFDDVVLQIPIRQGARAVGAGVVRDEEFATDVEHGKHQPLGLDPQCATALDIGNPAEIYSPRRICHRTTRH